MNREAINASLRELNTCGSSLYQVAAIYKTKIICYRVNFSSKTGKCILNKKDKLVLEYISNLVVGDGLVKTKEFINGKFIWKYNKIIIQEEE